MTEIHRRHFAVSTDEKKKSDESIRCGKFKKTQKLTN